MKKQKKLSDNEWAYICTIHTEPEYRFVMNERKVAERMANIGLLKRRGNNKYSVTTQGEKLYAAYKQEWDRKSKELNHRPKTFVIDMRLSQTRKLDLTALVQARTEKEALKIIQREGFDYWAEIHDSGQETGNRLDLASSKDKVKTKGAIVSVRKL